MSFEQFVSVPVDVLVREVSGESVLLNLSSETYFGLDHIGTRMWQLLTAGRSIRQAYERLLEEYDVAPDTLCSDLSRLIEELVRHGLVELRPA